MPFITQYAAHGIQPAYKAKMSGLFPFINDNGHVRNVGLTSGGTA